MENNRWVFLDPDNRKDQPEGLHCCRCMRPLKETQCFETFYSVEMHPEHPWIRRRGLGRYLIGSECWDKIKNDIVPDNYL